MGKIKYLLVGLSISVVALHLWLQPPHAADETIFTGGTILTMESASPTVEAVLIRGEKIIALGSLQKVKQQAVDTPDIIDLSGKTLMPGLIEPHTHPLATAMLGAAIDVSGFTHSNRTEVIESLRAGITEGGIGGWIMAFGWDPVMIADLIPPTLAELDTLSPEKPLVILTQMMHDAYANSAALKAAGITGESRAPVGGEFVKDKSGKLTGTVREISAIGVLLSAMPPAPEGGHAFLLNQQYKAYAHAGYTTIGVLGPVGRSQDPIGLIKATSNAEHSPLRTRIYGLPEQINHMPAPEGTEAKTPIIGVKFWMDGSPFAGGAAFEAPYEDTDLVTERLHLTAGHMGALNYSPDDFQALFQEYHIKGFQIAVHAQGERAVDRTLDIAEQVLIQHPRGDHRHRLEHNALITEAQLIRAHKLGFTTSFFVDHIYYYGHALDELIGFRTERYMPIKTALKVGHKATVHTDNPATPIGAFRAMQTLHVRAARANGLLIGQQEQLTPREALAAMTINAAWQLGLENETGSIKEGKSADFAILNANPLTTQNADLQTITVHSTWLKGQPVDTRTINYNSVMLGLDLLKNLFP